jgi:hypothetical protein
VNEISEVQAAGGPTLFQLKITLKYSRPPIWRRVVVRSDMRLDRLHTVIQLVMGWTDSHLHQFTVGQTRYGVPDPDLAFDDSVLNEKQYTLRDLASAAKKKFIYEYDFGDSWYHEVKVERALPADPDFKHPVCQAGENACPPEDCGGIPGYYQLLKVLADPKDPEYQDMKEWVGDDLDPTLFNREEANALLAKIKA